MGCKMIRFHAKGHKNITATHKNTLEITKDSNLTKSGDCIISTSADFNKQELKKIISGRSANPSSDGLFSSSEEKKENVLDGKLIISCREVKEEVNFLFNRSFDDDREIVIRKTGFLSSRTLGVYADASSREISRKLVKLLQNPENVIEIRIMRT